jgi:DNA-binding transcriptional regulator YiaG
MTGALQELQKACQRYRTTPGIINEGQLSNAIERVQQYEVSPVYMQFLLNYLQHTSQSLNESLIELRKKKNLTQAEFAVRCYVTRPEVGRWESDVFPNTFSIANIETIVHALDCTREQIAELITGFCIKRLLGGWSRR